jgi:hypothetical protein
MGDGKISDALRPHCLAAQDAALSRLKHEFEPRWGHTLPAAPGGFPFTSPLIPVEGTQD